MEKLSIYQKLHEARKYIKTCGAEKLGWNDYSEYKYFLPEQISQLTFEASENQKILPMFSLKRNELGETGFLTIVDLESDQSIVFEMATAIPEIKATNATQQVGGAVTFTERYLLQVAFDIKDNNIDPDTNDKKKDKGSKKEEDKEPDTWLNKWVDKKQEKESPEYIKVVNKAKEQGLKAKDLRQYYKISKAVFTELEIDLKN